MQVKRAEQLYRCVNFDCKGKGYFNANVVDSAIIWEAQRYYGQILKRKTNNYKEEIEEEKKILEQKIKQNKIEATEIETKIDKLQNDYYTVSTALTESRFKTILAKLLQQKDENVKQAKSYITESERIENKEKMINTNYFDSIISSLYDFDKNGIEIKKIINEIIKEVTVEKTNRNTYKIQITINDNFIYNNISKFTLYYERDVKHLYEKGNKDFEIPIYEIHKQKELTEEEIERRRIYYRNSNYKRRNKKGED